MSKFWKIKDMMIYAHQLYPLLDEGDDAYRKKIRRFLTEKGYVIPDRISGKNRFILPEKLAKYVINVELKDYFERNIDPLKREAFFKNKDAQLNGEQNDEELEVDYNSITMERKEFYENLWNHDDFTPMTDEEYEDTDIITSDYWDHYKVYLLKRHGYNPKYPMDPQNEEIMKNVDEIVEEERKYAYQRNFQAHKSLTPELALLGLNYIMLKEIVSQSFNFDEKKYIEDLRKWYQLIRLDNPVYPFRKGFSEINHRLKNPENYFSKK